MSVLASSAVAVAISSSVKVKVIASPPSTSHVIFVKSRMPFTLSPALTPTVSKLEPANVMTPVVASYAWPELSKEAVGAVASTIRPSPDPISIVSLPEISGAGALVGS